MLLNWLETAANSSCEFLANAKPEILLDERHALKQGVSRQQLETAVRR